MRQSGLVNTRSPLLHFLNRRRRAICMVVRRQSLGSFWTGSHGRSEISCSDASTWGPRDGNNSTKMFKRRWMSPSPVKMAPSDLAYLERARALVRANDIAAARLIFTRLANGGVAEAAFELVRGAQA